jgi:hypothetical protein
LVQPDNEIYLQDSLFIISLNNQRFARLYIRLCVAFLIDQQACDLLTVALVVGVSPVIKSTCSPSMR